MLSLCPPPLLPLQCWLSHVILAAGSELWLVETCPHELVCSQSPFLQPQPLTSLPCSSCRTKKYQGFVLVFCFAGILSSNQVIHHILKGKITGALNLEVTSLCLLFLPSHPRVSAAAIPWLQPGCCVFTCHSCRRSKLKLSRGWVDCLGGGPFFPLRFSPSLSVTHPEVWRVEVTWLRSACSLSCLDSAHSALSLLRPWGWQRPWWCPGLLGFPQLTSQCVVCLHREHLNRTEKLPWGWKSDVASVFFLVFFFCNPRTWYKLPWQSLENGGAHYLIFLAFHCRIR